MFKKYKSNSNKKLATVFISAIVALLVLVLGFSTTVASKANVPNTFSDMFYDYAPIALSIPNKQFEETSGSYPMTATGWAEHPIGNFASAMSGVIDLTPSSFDENRKTYELERYYGTSEYPFANKNQSSNKKNVLFINTKSMTTITTIASSTVDLKKNGYFIFSVWVKTSNFSGNSGASISLTGLKHDLAYTGINTNMNGGDYDSDSHNDVGSEDNNYNWKKYQFFVHTGFETSTVAMQLSVGYGLEGEDSKHQTVYAPARGYAMFSNIVAEQVSPLLYSQLLKGEDIKTIDDYTPVLNSVQVPARGVSNFEYSPYDNRVLQYDKAKHDIIDPNDVNYDVDYDRAAINNGLTNLNNLDSSGNPGNIPFWDGGKSNMAPVDVEHFLPNSNLKTNPMSPTGHGKIMMMTTYDDQTDQYKLDDMSLSSGDAYAEVDQYSPQFMLIKRQQYYRLSIWVKTIDVSDGAGAFVRVTGNNTQYNSEKPSDSYKLNIVDNNIVSEESKETYGWTEKAYYIKGSSIKDTQIRMTVGLGNKTDGQAKGTVLWCNPTMTVLTQQEYTGYSSEGTSVTFDEAIDTGIKNGTFSDSGTFDKYRYPLPAESWTYKPAHESGTADWSTSPVDTSTVKYGIVPTDNEHFEQNKNDNNYPDTLINPIIDGYDNYGLKVPNLMLLYSANPTAIGVSSTEFSVGADTPKALQVKLMSNTIGFGSALVLKNNGLVISTIENIPNTHGQFETYTFYIQGDASNTLDSLTIEAWLGMGDSQLNQSRQSSGYVYISKVSLVDLATALPADQKDWEFGDKLNEYQTMLASENYNNYWNLVSTATDDFLMFDRYDSNGIKKPYNWSLSSLGENADINNENSAFGIYNGTKLTTGGNGNGYIPTDLYHNSESAFGAFMSIGNTAYNGPDGTVTEYGNAAKLNYNKQWNTSASSYYKITVPIVADLSKAQGDDQIGLEILLNNTDFKFENIKDTRRFDDENKDDWARRGYKDYIFYVDSQDQSPTLSISITLGGIERKQWVSGRVLVSTIKLETIDKHQFDVETADIDTDNALENRLVANLAIEDNGTGGGNSSSGEKINPLILLPSILFSVALIIAIIGIVLRKLAQRATVLSKPNQTQVNGGIPSYDRRVVNPHAGIDSTTGVNTYNEFDDDDTIYTQVSPPQSSTNMFDDDEPLQDFDASNYQPQTIATSDNDGQSIDASQVVVDNDDTIATVHSIDIPTYIVKTSKDTKTTNSNKKRTYIDEWDD